MKGSGDQQVHVKNGSLLFFNVFFIWAKAKSSRRADRFVSPQFEKVGGLTIRCESSISAPTFNGHN
jgi:hypothetical protein